jgi:hypothetical protein
MDPVAKRDQLLAHGGKKSKTKSCMDSWLSLNQGQAGTTWQPSHEWDWCGGCTESAGFAAVHHKTVRLLG